MREQALVVEISTGKFEQTLVRFLAAGQPVAAQYTSKEQADKLASIKAIVVRDKRVTRT